MGMRGVALWVRRLLMSRPWCSRGMQGERDSDGKMLFGIRNYTEQIEVGWHGDCMSALVSR
jgi:hypothetical protein